MAASNTPKKSTTKHGTSAKKKSSARTQSKTWWKCRRKHQQGTHGSNGTDGLYFSRCTFYYGSISDLQ